MLAELPRWADHVNSNSPIIDDTALNSVNSRFVTELVRDALSEYSYDAELAGLSYTFDSQADGIVLTVDGYNDKLAVLAQVVFEKMKTLIVDPKRFDIIKDQVSRVSRCAKQNVCPLTLLCSRSLNVPLSIIDWSNLINMLHSLQPISLKRQCGLRKRSLLN